VSVKVNVCFAAASFDLLALQTEIYGMKKAAYRTAAFFLEKVFFVSYGV